MSVNSVGGPHAQSALLMNSTSQIEAELGGDTDAQIAALMLVTSNEQREALREARQVEEQRLSKAEANQIQSMLQRAQDVRSAGEWQGVGCLVGGGIEIGSSFVNSKRARTGLAGGAEMANGGAKFHASSEQFEADVANADAAKAGHQADDIRRQLDDIADGRKNADDVTQKALDLVEQTREAQSATNQAALFRRA